jgi:hypothetical protein
MPKRGHETMSDLETRTLQLKNRVQEWLTEKFNNISVGENGSYSFRIESTRLFVRVGEFGEENLVIGVSAPVLLGVPVTQEFKDYVLDGSFVFGGFDYFEDEEGANLVFRHSILGDYVDKEEFLNSVYAVGITAERLDDELKDRFGGRRMHED